MCSHKNRLIEAILMRTHNLPFFIRKKRKKKKKITLDYPKSAAMGFLGPQEQVPNIRGKQAISVQATDVLLYNNI